MSAAAETADPLRHLSPEQRHDIAVRAEARLATPIGRFGEAQFWAQGVFERLSKPNLRSAIEAGRAEFVDDHAGDNRAVLDELQKARSLLQHARRDLDETIRLTKREAKHRRSACSSNVDD